MTTVEWKAPGPGGWMADDNHYKGTISGFMSTVMPGAMGTAMAHGFRRYGILMETARMGIVNGRLYFQPKIVGAPAPKEGKTSSPPPKAIMRLLFVVHPELRRRRRSARAALATKLWRADRARWRTQDEPKLRARNLALGAVDASALGDAALVKHFDDCLQQFIDGNFVHFDNNLASSFPVGDWAIRACEWTGCKPAEAVAVFQGANPSSAATLDLLNPVADAVRRSPDGVALVRASGDATARLEQLHALTPEIAAALEAYLAEHGNRIVTGFDVSDRTLHEMPHIVLAGINSQIDARVRPDIAGASRDAATRLRERVPASARTEYDALLAEAQAAYGLHDEDVGTSWMWPLGLLRRALLAIGNRLETSGALKDAEHIFDCTPEEVRALGNGAAVAPSALAVARRVEERNALEDLVAPATLGPQDPPPPPGMLPPECERMMNAIMFYLTQMNTPPAAPGGPGAPLTDTALKGTAASRGRYEGRARVICGPSDFDRLAQGDVLVASTTSPTYNVVLPLLGAVVTDRGGALCHAAIVAREFGIPAVVGTYDATKRIPDGARVIVDGEAGTVEILT